VLLSHGWILILMAGSVPACTNRNAEEERPQGKNKYDRLKPVLPETVC
jgi:hypothetical protein